MKLLRLDHGAYDVTPANHEESFRRLCVCATSEIAAFVLLSLPTDTLNVLCQPRHLQSLKALHASASNFPNLEVRLSFVCALARMEWASLAREALSSLFHSVSQDRISVDLRFTAGKLMLRNDTSALFRVDFKYRSLSLTVFWRLRDLDHTRTNWCAHSNRSVTAGICLTKECCIIL